MNGTIPAMELRKTCPPYANFTFKFKKKKFF